MMELAQEQFWHDFERMAAIGATAQGGCERLAMSDADMAARSLLMQLMQEAGLAVTQDATGAIWGRLEGENPALPPALVGSHIDTVRNGGRYDGLLGVMLGLQALRQIAQQQKPQRPLALVVFPTEESARFNYPTVGSKLLAGKITPDKLHEMKDADGVSLHEALCARGFDPDHPQAAQQQLRAAYSMLELHIEQGPLLESRKIPIGIVEAIAAPTRLRVEITGEYAHSGACPMHLRRDALAAAAELTLAVERVGNAEAVSGSVAAVTLCELVNSSMNVVPGQVRLGIDVRGIDHDSIARCVGSIRRYVGSICDRRKAVARVEVISSDEPVAMSAEMMRLLRRCCDKAHLRHLLMPSGAGHDAMNVAPLIPTGMLFIPCRGGVSHNPREEVSRADVADGFKVLCAALLEQAHHA